MLTTSVKPLLRDETVFSSTGKNWGEWVQILDSAGAQKMPHREIVRFLLENRHVQSTWWSQMITNGYEKIRKRRVVGSTSDVGYQIGVTKTLHITPETAWKFLMSRKGRMLWLGESKFLLKRGFRYITRRGVKGEIRTFRRGEFVRLIFRPSGNKRASVLQIRVTERGTTRGTCIGFHQEKLADGDEREKMRTHWKEVLRLIEKALKK